MIFDDINDMKDFGFNGFEKADTLMKYECSQIPKQRGIYFILIKDSEPNFLQQSVGGHFKGKNPTVEVDELKLNWVDDTKVVYIGQAGGGNSKATLHKRLKQYMRFGEGKPVGHWGGRYIWQLAHHRDLIICYKPLSYDDPRDIEKKLISEFESYYGRLPFANLVR